MLISWKIVGEPKPDEPFRIVGTLSREDLEPLGDGLIIPVPIKYNGHGLTVHALDGIITIDINATRGARIRLEPDSSDFVAAAFEVVVQ
jgi:hypothetical protein